MERGLGHAEAPVLHNLDFAPGAGVETLRPYLDADIEICKVETEAFEPAGRGLYTFVNSLHALPPEKARAYLRKIAESGNPVVAVEGNNDNWWQAVGMLIFVPLSVLLSAPFVRPFRFSRLLFSWLLPILPVVTSVDGALALFKLYNPSDLDELTAAIDVPGYRWEAGKRNNGRGGAIIYLLGYRE